METELRLSQARCNTLRYLDLKDSTEATEEIWVKPRKLDCSAGKNRARGGREQREAARTCQHRRLWDGPQHPAVPLPTPGTGRGGQSTERGGGCPSVPPQRIPAPCTALVAGERAGETTEGAVMVLIFPKDKGG